VVGYEKLNADEVHAALARLPGPGQGERAATREPGRYPRKAA
jgi:hypothetical protein